MEGNSQQLSSLHYGLCSLKLLVPATCEEHRAYGPIEAQQLVTLCQLALLRVTFVFININLLPNLWHLKSHRCSNSHQ